MAEDDAKGRAKRMPQTSKKPRTAKKPPTKKPTAKKPPALAAAARSPTAKTRALPMGLWGGLAAMAIVAALVLAWPGARDRLAQLISGPEPSRDALVAAPSRPQPVAAAEPAADDARWAKLADRLGALEGSLDRLGADIAALKSAPVAAISTLEQRLAALEARPRRSPAGAAALAGIEKRLAALTGSLKAMEDRLAGTLAASDEAGSLALLALAGALRRGAPHGALAAAARAAMAKSDSGAALGAGLDALAAYAAKGVPSKAALAARFDALSRPVVAATPPPAKAEPKPEQPTGFWDKVRARVSKLVKYRRVGNENAPVPDAPTLARATTAKALVMGDLAAANQASNGLVGPEAEAWRKDLRARLKADGLADALDAMIARRVGRAAAAP